VRLAFSMTGTAWKAFDHAIQDIDALKSAAGNFAGRREWFVLDHSKAIAKVVSTGVNEYDWYQDVGMQNVLSALPVMAKGPRTLRYSGWMGCPVRKPLVVSTRIPAKDTENWRREKPSYAPTKEIAGQILNALFGHSRQNDGTSGKRGLSPRDVFAAEQFCSKGTAKLVAFQVRPSAQVVDNAGQPDRALYWFFMDGRKSVKFVGRGLVLIDWADYDSDGKTDFVFWVDGYNVNGYLLAWNDFENRVSFTWNYF